MEQLVCILLLSLRSQTADRGSQDKVFDVGEPLAEVLDNLSMLFVREREPGFPHANAVNSLLGSPAHQPQPAPVSIVLQLVSNALQDVQAGQR